MIETVLMAMIAAIVYGLSVYLRKGEPMEWTKLGMTAIIGGLVGFIAGMTGIVPTEGYVIEQMSAYAGLSVVLENILKLIYKKVTSV